MKSKNITIMLADDHVSARQAYAAVINAQKNLEVIGQAGNGQELLALVKLMEPDITILDLGMPVMDGRAALIELQIKHPGVKVIILSAHNEERFICDSLMNGASGYLSKGCFVEEIIETINRVYNDGFFFKGLRSKKVIKEVDDALLISTLSEREINVLKLYCNGLLFKEIGDKLSVSVETVKFHMKNIRTKAHVGTLQQLVKFALKNAITELD